MITLKHLKLIETIRQVSIQTLNISKIKKNLIKSKWFSKSERIYIKKIKCVVFAKFVAKVPFENCDPEFIEVFCPLKTKASNRQKLWWLFPRMTTCWMYILNFENIAFLIGLNHCQKMRKMALFLTITMNSILEIQLLLSLFWIHKWVILLNCIAFLNKIFTTFYSQH